MLMAKLDKLKLTKYGVLDYLILFFIFLANTILGYYFSRWQIDFKVNDNLPKNDAFSFYAMASVIGNLGLDLYIYRELDNLKNPKSAVIKSAMLVFLLTFISSFLFLSLIEPVGKFWRYLALLSINIALQALLSIFDIVLIRLKLYKWLFLFGCMGISLFLITMRIFANFKYGSAYTELLMSFISLFSLGWVIYKKLPDVKNVGDPMQYLSFENIAIWLYTLLVALPFSLEPKVAAWIYTGDVGLLASYGVMFITVSFTINRFALLTYISAAIRNPLKEVYIFRYFLRVVFLTSLILLGIVLAFPRLYIKLFHLYDNGDSLYAARFIVVAGVLSLIPVLYAGYFIARREYGILLVYGLVGAIILDLIPALPTNYSEMLTLISWSVAELVYGLLGYLFYKRVRVV